MKLEVGMYVRTHKGIIFKLNQEMLNNPMTFFAIIKVNLYDKDNKVSFNKIDLIEAGDIVVVNKNKYEVVFIEDNKIAVRNIDINSRDYEGRYEFRRFDIKDIDSIVTKEQFKASEYDFGSDK